MEYFAKLILGNSMERRQQQLEKQAIVDAKLDELKCRCTVADYLLHQRRWNRQCMKDYKGISFLEVPAVTKNHLDMADRELDRLDKCLKTQEPCKCLPESPKRVKSS